MFRRILKLFSKPPPPILRIATIPSWLSPYVTPFGSRIWGGARDDSDIDLFIHPDNLIALHSELNKT